MKKAILLLFILGIVGIGAVYATEYPYWIENSTDGLWIWTKVNISANSNITLYIQKKPGYQPDGNKVFLFFDDFNGTSLDTNKWALSGSGTVSVGNGTLTVSPPGDGSTEAVYSIDTFSPQIVVGFYHKKGYGALLGWEDPTNLGAGTGTVDWHTASSVNTWYLAVGDGTNWITANLGSPDTTNWHLDEIVVKSDGATLYRDGNLMGSVSQNQAIASGSIDIRAWIGSVYVDYVYVRKYADQEPQIFVEQISTDAWKVIISNPNNFNLVDFQVKINGSGIVTDTNDSLLITDTLANATISFNITSTELRPHQPITINISNYTGNVLKFIINWGDGTTTELNSTETIANHTYNWEDNFKIIVSSIDSEGNVLAVNSTTVKVVYNISEIPYKYLIKVANPTSQNYINYPLKITLDASNFDFFIPKPLGTDIYFRDENGTIYKHFIENYSIADQKATIWVQIPYIAPNSYAEFYLCIDRDGHDRPQYTFDTSTTSPYILYTVIPEFQNTQSENLEFGNITRVSSTTNDYQNCTILILDELGYIKENKHKGTIRVINEKGDEVIYTFNEGYIGGIIQVPASTPDGLLIFLTEDGIMRKIHYNVSKINIILVPNGAFAPVLLKGANGKKWLIYKNDGSFVTVANDESVVQLAVGGEYDFYIEGNPNPVKKDYMITGNGDVIYAKFVPTYEPNLILTQQIFQNDSVKFTVVTNGNITIEFSYNGTKENVSVGAGTWTFIKPDGTNYTIYVNGQIYKTGTLGGENWGLLGEFPKEYPDLAKWLGFGIIILVLLAGSFITIYVSVPLAIIVALILIRLGWIEFDLLTTSIFILIGLASFAYFYLKRNW
ncbi:DUF2341 domain-containing protein (plasmid) [Methanocaldococcus sp. 16A]